MLSRLGNIFRVPDLRNKVLFTLLIIGLYQVGRQRTRSRGQLGRSSRRSRPRPARPASSAS